MSNNVSTLFLITSAIWGIFWFIFFIFPFVMYGIHFFGKNDGGDKKTMGEKILTVIILHIAFGIVFFMVSFTISNIFKAHYFNPCQGLRYFLFGITNTNCNVQVYVHSTMWNAWDKIANELLNNSVSNPVTQTVHNAVTIISTFATFFFFILFFIVIMIFSIPFVVIARAKINARMYDENPSMLYQLFKAFLIAWFIYYLTYVHFYIVSRVTSSITNVNGFDLFLWAKETLREILGFVKIH